MKELLITIITSEKTWSNISKHNLDKQLRALREKFDLAIVLNGFNANAVNFYKEFVPDYFFLRKNIGFDPAAFAYFIKLIPIYKYTVVLHDDHWFSEENWIDYFTELANSDKTIDVWGNIYCQSVEENFLEFIKTYNFAHLIKNYSSCFINGLSGIFSAKAIAKLKEINLEFPNTESKEIASLAEFVFSQVLLNFDIKYEQIPQGVNKFLIHGENAERDYYFWTANNALFNGDGNKALEYYFKYLDYCKKTNFKRDLFVVYYNIANCYYSLKDFNNAVNYAKKSLELNNLFNLPIQLLVKIKDELNI